MYATIWVLVRLKMILSKHTSTEYSQVSTVQLSFNHSADVSPVVFIPEIFISVPELLYTFA
jgi:hypothetical protein